MPTKVYVGHLPIDKPVKERDLEDLFSKYGRIESTWIARQPPGFAFVTFRDRQVAEKVCEELHSQDFKGKSLRCEISSGGNPDSAFNARDFAPRGRGGRDRSRSSRKKRSRSRSSSRSRSRRRQRKRSSSSRSSSSSSSSSTSSSSKGKKKKKKSRSRSKRKSRSR